jgi:hypothetical protein
MLMRFADVNWHPFTCFATEATYGLSDPIQHRQCRHATAALDA